jgi:hypothetical protein
MHENMDGHVSCFSKIFKNIILIAIIIKASVTTHRWIVSAMSAAEIFFRTVLFPVRQIRE